MQTCCSNLRVTLSGQRVALETGPNSDTVEGGSTPPTLQTNPRSLRFDGGGRYDYPRNLDKVGHLL